MSEFSEATMCEKRYQLAIAASQDGLWEWDLVNNEFYTTTTYKEKLGYGKGEIEDTYEAWVNLIHDDDVEKAEEKMNTYLLSREGVYENIYRVRCKDGSYRWILSKAKAIWHADGWAMRIGGSHTDITEQKELEDRLYCVAYYDVLTGLPNRSLFEEKINEKINKYKGTNSQFAIIHMNTDNFRQINDTWGYDVGDQLLKYIASVFRKYEGQFDVCAHLSGDEFAIVMDQVSNRTEVVRKLKKFLQVFQEPWEFEENKIFITFSTGIVMYPEGGDNLYLLLANADTAMWHVKYHGKDGYSFYTTDIQTQRIGYIQTASQIKTAFKNHEFIVYYQPQVNLLNGSITGVEALIRWQHPERGMISPMEFIPLAETTGEIHAIGRFVLESVCKQKKIWEEKGYPPIPVAVNISGLTLTRGDLGKEIKKLLNQYQIQGSGIKVEVTETAIMKDLDMAINTLEQLKELGIQVALDDFGTGYSSLTYLNKLPINIVKIDREFIKNIKSINDQEIMVEIIAKIAQALDLEVIVEGVETKEQLQYIIQFQCGQAQGYFFDRPMPADDLDPILKLGFKYPIER